MNVKPCLRNKRTLNNFRDAITKANHQIDDDKWAAMQTNTTVPFDPPPPRHKIAVKVIDRTGTEHSVVIDDWQDPALYW